MFVLAAASFYADAGSYDVSRCASLLRLAIALYTAAPPARHETVTVCDDRHVT